MRRQYLLAVLILCLFSFNPAHSATTTLTEPQTGLTLQAQKGAVLSMSSKGIYSLKIKKSFAKFMTARSPLSFDDTIKSFIDLSKMKSVRKSGKNGKVTVKGKVNGKSVQLLFTSAGSAIDVITFGGKSTKRRSARAPISPRPIVARATVPLTPADIGALQRALNTRQGGVTVPLQLPIPTKVFTSPQDKTTAIVPDLPGWSFNGGGGGIISGGAAGQGVFEFGVPVFAFPYGPAPIVSPPVDCDKAIFSVWPQYAKSYTGAQVQVTGVRLINGTAGFLAPDFASSGLFEIAFKLNGEDWQGLMSSGTTFAPGVSDGTFIWYHTYIAVPVNGPGGIAPALMNTWASWNHTAADQQRLAEAFNTLLSIQGGGGPIDEEVFQEKANAWDKYIRE